MANAQVRVQLIPHARGHYLSVAGYRYSVKTRKRGRDAELVYWKCTEKDCPGTENTRDNILTSLPRDHNHPPSDADVKSKLFMAHIKEKVRNCLNPIPTLYEDEIVQLRTREWDDDTQKVVEKITTFIGCKSSLYRDRNKDVPQQPKNRQGIDLQNEWRETTAGTSNQHLFFLFNKDLDIDLNNRNNNF